MFTFEPRRQVDASYTYHCMPYLLLAGNKNAVVFLFLFLVVAHTPPTGRTFSVCAEHHRNILFLHSSLNNYKLQSSLVSWHIAPKNTNTAPGPDPVAPSQQRYDGRQQRRHLRPRCVTPIHSQPCYISIGKMWWPSKKKKNKKDCTNLVIFETSTHVCTAKQGQSYAQKKGRHLAFL